MRWAGKRGDATCGSVCVQKSCISGQNHTAKLTFFGPKLVITLPSGLLQGHVAHDPGSGAPARRRHKLSRSKLRTAVVGGALIALGLAASGCASHRFVRDQIEVVDGRVTQVEGTAGQALQRANDAHKLAEG